MSLETLANCTPSAINHFPTAIFSRDQLLEGAIVLHIFITIYCFVGVALVCTRYFVPTCEILSELLNLPRDVAGATFMAGGGSVGELAISCVAVFISEDDTGLGTVVGSAVFNITCVIGLSALLAGAVIPVGWWPVSRDCIFYSLGVITLTLVIMDGRVHWYEALALIVVYIFYIIMMCFNGKIHGRLPTECCNLTHCCNKSEGEHTELIDVKDDPVHDHQTFQQANSQPAIENTTTEQSEKDVASPLAWPDTWPRRIFWIFCLPITVFLFLTIPDCRRERWRRFYPLTFLMSVLWIGGFSYIMIWMITVIGYTFNIPDSVVGLTFIAIGSSVPDAFASVTVARQGHGSMAMSNALGSNIFDILVCLGIPWFIKTAIVSPGSVVAVYSAGLTYSSMILLSTVLLLLLATILNCWKMNKKYGVTLLVSYCVITTINILYELNIFGYVHPPECPRT